jgi:hypothetical protein
MKARCVALLAAIAAIAYLSARPVHSRALEQHLGGKEAGEAAATSQSDLEEIVSIVHQEGLLVDFGLICAAIGLVHQSADCRFRQLSMRLETEHADVLAFNVPADAEKGVTCVVVFHTASDLGEIYVISMRAELLRAYVVQANGRFEKIGLADARATFLVDLAYWSRHLTSFYDTLGLERPPHRR